MQGVAFELIFPSVRVQQVNAGLPRPRALCSLTGIGNSRARSCLGSPLGREILREETPFLC